MKQLKVINWLKVMLLAGACGVVAVVQGQQQRVYDSTTIALFSEMESLQSMFSGDNRLSFKATYYMEDIYHDVEIGTTITRDTVVGQYKMHGQRFWASMDSILEYIQDDKLLAAFYHDNKTAVLQKPSPVYKQVLQVDIHNAVFQQLAMKGMTAADSGQFRKLTIQFDSTALYTHYEVVYDTASQLLVHIKYATRKDLDPQSANRVNLHIVFSHYQVDAFDDSVFATGRFFTQYNSKDIRLEQLYADYEVVNLLEDR